MMMKVNNIVDPELITEGFFGFFLLCTISYCIQHCFFCRSSDSTVSENAGIEHRTIATLAVAVRRSNNSARSYLLGYLLT
jgi:hypothetical protein